MPRRVEIPYRESQPPAPKQQETGRWLSRRFFYDSSPSTWIKTSAVTAFTSALSFGTYLSAQDEDGEDTLTASIGLTTGVLSLAISVGSACLYRLSAQHNPKRAVLNALASKNEDAALLALESLSEGERRDLLTWSRDKLISLIRENNCYKCCAFLLPQMDAGELRELLLWSMESAPLDLIEPFLDEMKSTDIRSADSQGRTALILAARRGDSAVFNALLPHFRGGYDNEQWLLQGDNKGWTALHHAVAHKQDAIFESLIALLYPNDERRLSTWILELKDSELPVAKPAIGGLLGRMTSARIDLPEMDGKSPLELVLEMGEFGEKSSPNYCHIP